MIGIYKVTNKINGKSYVGQSVDIQRRWTEHKNINGKATSASAVRASIKKYGVESFTFEVLEECRLEELNKREAYWIKKLGTFGGGYNLNPGGEQATIGEDNPNAKVTEQDVIAIRTEYKARKRTRRDVYKDYERKITFSAFARIWDGSSWQHIMPEIYTKESKEHYSRKTTLGGKAPGAIFSDEEVVELRKRYVNETAKEIYADYEERCGYQTLQQVLWGRKYSHLPIYKKKTKEWIGL